MNISKVIPAAKPHPRVGVGIIVEKEGKLLLGLRKGSHGASTWSPPGGHLEFAEGVEECAKRELLEETGLRATSCTLGPWVENVMENGKKHYITLYVRVDQFEGEVQLLEPDKCEEWHWFLWNELPTPLFAPMDSFFQLLGSDSKGGFTNQNPAKKVASGMMLE
jgi:8-oxo-dGTP diphosphatase